MAVPDFQTLMLPLLKFYGDGEEHSIQEAIDELAHGLELSEEDLKQLLPSGKQTTFYNRVGWARTYLAKSGLLEASRRSYYKITNRGQQVLKENPLRIDMKYLEQFLVTIDFDQEMITFSKDFPDRSAYSKKSTSVKHIKEADHIIPFTCIDQRPLVWLGINDPLNQARMKIGTGNSTTFVSMDYINKKGTAGKAILDRGGDWIKEKSTTASGPHNIKEKNVVIDKIFLEDLVLEHFPLEIRKDILLSSGLDGNLGMDFLSRFNLTLDFRNRYMMLKKNHRYSKLTEDDLKKMDINNN